MKVFITGANGYLGRNLVKHFVSQGHVVRALVRTLENGTTLKEIGAEIVVGDLHSPDLVKMLSSVDVLVHAAGDTDHKNISRTQYETNVIGTENIFTAAKKAGVKKGIHISTDSVMLTGTSLTNLTEDLPYPKKAVGEYSRTKKLAEEKALGASDEAFSVTVLRPRFVWGEDDTTALPYLIEAVKKQQFAWIDGGNYLTSTTHIHNLCHAVSCAIENGGQKEIYFISDERPLVFKEIISALIRSQGFKPPTKSVPRKVLRAIACVDEARRKLMAKSKPLPLSYQEYATSAVEVTLNITKAKEQLKYKPVVSFEEGVKSIKLRT